MKKSWTPTSSSVAMALSLHESVRSIVYCADDKKPTDKYFVATPLKKLIDPALEFFCDMNCLSLFGCDKSFRETGLVGWTLSLSWLQCDIKLIEPVFHGTNVACSRITVLPGRTRPAHCANNSSLLTWSRTASGSACCCRCSRPSMTGIFLIGWLLIEGVLLCCGSFLRLERPPRWRASSPRISICPLRDSLKKSLRPISAVSRTN